MVMRYIQWHEQVVDDKEYAQEALVSPRWTHKCARARILPAYRTCILESYLYCS